jgi:hypothetical protein
MTEQARNFLESIVGYTKTPGAKVPSFDRPIRLAIVDEAYMDGLVKVRFDGEEQVGTKGYPALSSYNPVADDRVALIPVGSSYLIIGKVDPTPRTFPQWHDLEPLLENGWNVADVPISSFQSTPEYIRQSDGLVKVKGLVAGGTYTNETVIATLPEGYRPTGQLHFATIQEDQPMLIRVDPAGKIRIGRFALESFDPDVAPGGGWISLDPITFVAQR